MALSQVKFTEKINHTKVLFQKQHIYVLDEKVDFIKAENPSARLILLKQS